MDDLTNQLARAINSVAKSEGLSPTTVAGVHCIKFSTVDRRTKRRWRARLGIVAQGSKQIVLGRTVYRFGAGDFTAVPIDLPVVSQISTASSDAPFLALLIDLDPLVLAEISAQLGDDLPSEPVNLQRAAFTGKAGSSLLGVALRLTELFGDPVGARVLGPLVIKEAIYHLLKSSEGPAIRQFVRAGSKTHQVCQSIYSLRSALNEEVDVQALAKGANMSRSAYFKHFKEVTSVSPIQYQKRLRLLEARRLMVELGETAERSAFNVGYNSASQFSREYSRMFGKSPLRDAGRFISEQRPMVS